MFIFSGIVVAFYEMSNFLKNGSHQLFEKSSQPSFSSNTSTQVKNDLETVVNGNYAFSAWILLSDGALPTSDISDSTTPLAVLFLPYCVIREYYHIMPLSSLLPLEDEDVPF